MKETICFVVGSLMLACVLYLNHLEKEYAEVIMDPASMEISVEYKGRQYRLVPYEVKK